MKASEKVLLLRYTNYKRFDFIKEHTELIKSNKSVWMLKIGKMIPETKLLELYHSGGFLILRSPKSDGGKYYLLTIKSAFNGAINEYMVFPEYYNKMLNDDNVWLMDDMIGTWFEVSKIKELSKEYSDHLTLVSNGKKVEDVLNSTRSSMIYVVSDIEIK